VRGVRDVVESGDPDAFSELLAPDVVWVGVLPGQLCRSRDDVLAMFRRAADNGRRARPEILAETSTHTSSRPQSSTRTSIR
jgi:hypothetical protein